ncbi:MAG: hypothetical protein EPO00_03165, partial [Chloroflexota bacterium]
MAVRVTTAPPGSGPRARARPGCSRAARRPRRGGRGRRRGAPRRPAARRRIPRRPRPRRGRRRSSPAPPAAGRTARPEDRGEGQRAEDGDGE